MRAAQSLTCFLAVCLTLASEGSARADFIIDDFGEPEIVEVRVIDFLDPDPTLIQTPDPDIPGGERDILLDVIGTPGLSTFIGEIGGGSFIFNGSTPGTTAVIQYDGLDVDPEGPPGALINSEGLGGMDLTTFGGLFGLELLRIEGGITQFTDIEIEVHSSTSTATFSGAIADNTTASTFTAPFSAFSDPGVFTDVTSIEFRINPSGTGNVDFQLGTILVIVPEPSMIAMGAAILAGLLLQVLRRKKTA